MEMSALTFFSWAVMSIEGWSCLMVEGVALAEGSVVVGLKCQPTGGGWLAAGGWLATRVGSRRLGLATGAVGL